MDDISAALYNVVFTSMPILLFAVLDRPLSDISFLQFPQIYNKVHSLGTAVFWRTGVVHGLVDAAICFFIPFFAPVASGRDSNHGLYAVGKTTYIALLGVVTLEVSLVARYWTKLFVFFVVLSYVVVYPFFLVFPYAQRAFEVYDPAQYGIAENLFSTAEFWFIIGAVYVIAFSYRYFIRTIKWVFFPDDNMIISEYEHGIEPSTGLDKDPREKRRMQDLGYQRSSAELLGTNRSAEVGKQLEDGSRIGR